jgi:peptidoglycan/LPS O-acetylase OafA/YrhL
VAATVDPGHVRFPCFDGLRALAALAVVMTHVASLTGANTSTSAGYVLAHLDVGVSIFFLLSGFLLYRPFALAHLTGRPSPSAATYLRRRILRIFPAYWVALTFFIVVLGTIHLHNTLDAVAYYGLIQIYWRSRALGGIVATYSLAIEWSFYLFLPLYAAVLARWGRRARSPVRAEYAGVAGLYVVGLTTHAALLASHAHSTVATLWLPSQIDLFAVGMALAVASASAAQVGSLPRVLASAGRHPARCWAGAAVAFIIAATMLHLPRTFGDLPKRGELGRQVCYMATALGLVLPGVFGPQDRGVVRLLLRSRPAQLVGLVSYGVFLWHMDWLGKLVAWGAGDWLGLRYVSVLLITLVVTLPFALASYLGIERPLVRRGVRTPPSLATVTP